MATRHSKYVDPWTSEKKIASELEKLRREVTKLHSDIRGGAIPLRPENAGPALPTEPERKLRPMSPDGDDPSGHEDT